MLQHAIVINSLTLSSLRNSRVLAIQQYALHYHGVYIVICTRRTELIRFVDKKKKQTLKRPLVGNAVSCGIRSRKRFETIKRQQIIGRRVDDSACRRQHRTRFPAGGNTVNYSRSSDRIESRVPTRAGKSAKKTNTRVRISYVWWPVAPISNYPVKRTERGLMLISLDRE